MFIQERKIGEVRGGYQIKLKPKDTGEGTKKTNIMASGKMQATIGIHLEHVYKLFQEDLTWDNLKKLYNEENKEIYEFIPDLSFLSNIQGNKSKSLLALVLFYIYRDSEFSGQSKDGPKAAFRVMARNDFHSLYNLLNEGEQTIFKD